MACLLKTPFTLLRGVACEILTQWAVAEHKQSYERMVFFASEKIYRPRLL